MSLKDYIPWWGKIGAKIVLARLPFSYEVLNKFGLITLEGMAQPSYAYDVFKEHFDRVRPKEGFVCLELGPGDSAFSALISRAVGSSACYLVDAEDFVKKDIQLYRDMANFLKEKELPTPDLQNLQSLEEVLDCCSAQFLTAGLSSLRAIPDQSVDFIFSQAVLEHVRRAEFLDVMRELRRIIRDDGACSHQVDLRDHLENALNNLRFPKNLWESDIMVNSGFYTNRIQFSQMLDLFQKAGFNAEVITVRRWDELPTPRTELSKEFRQLSDEELCVSGFSVVLKPV